MARLTEDWEGQHLESIPLDRLVLWSENPRDPIDPNADNGQVIDNALHGDGADTAWALDKLAKLMGGKYDLSMLPTVSPIEGTDKFTVYDGNRRVMLAMIKAWDAPSPELRGTLPLFPEEIPCNVCSREEALGSVFRRHVENGTWNQYERDVFAYRYMGGQKSVLVRVEELVGAITKWPALNRRYVKEDVLNDKHLREFGLDPMRDDYGIAPELLEELMEAVANSIAGKLMDTRHARNDPAKVLPEELMERIRESAANHAHDEGADGLPDASGRGGSRQHLAKEDEATDGRRLFDVDPARAGASDDLGECDERYASSDDNNATTDARKPGDGRRTRVTKEKEYQVFNGTLRLRAGDVNNLYRTLECLWEMNEKGVIKKNAGFYGVFRMGLRLLAETAAKEDQPKGQKDSLQRFVDKYVRQAKKALRESSAGDDIVNFLDAQSITKKTMLRRLQGGAHSYVASNSRDQAIAVSILLAEMLKLSHGIKQAV